MLQLILGRAGYGKTEYVFSSIKQRIDAGEQRLLLIIPEQFSFISEKRLLTDLGEARVNEVESTSFTRLADEVLKTYGDNSRPVLTKGAKAVMMKKAIETVQDSLSLFHHNITSLSFIRSACRIYDEMKSCRVSVEDIFDASAHTDKALLSGKLKDLGAIIGAYDALIDGQYYDEANELTRLYETLLQLEYFKDRTVYIDGFSGFVAQEYKILEVILQQAKDVYITFCSDSVMNRDSFHIFSYVNDNIAILKSVADKIGVEMKKPIFLTTPKRFQNDALARLEINAFENIKECYDDVPQGMRLFACSNVADECDNIALEISKLLRDGYRASDIAVIVRDLEKYERELSFAFAKYNIPYFDDERQHIQAEPLMMFVSFMLRVFLYSYRSDDILSLLKTGLTALDDDAVAELENYVYLWSINGRKWKNDFTESTKGFTEHITDSDRKKIESINASRKYIMERLTALQRKMKGRTAAEISKYIYYAMIDFSADERLKEIAVSLEQSGKSALAKEQGRVWDLLMEILDKLAVIGGDAPVSIKEYYKLFTLMLANEDVGTIPVGLDNVQLGAADRIRCDNPRAVFIAGANEGEFPQNVTSSGLLNENDRTALIQNHFKLYSYGKTLQAQEKYFAYMAMNAASEKLYISYIDNGSSQSESEIVREVKAVYPHIVTETPRESLCLSRIESKQNAFALLAAHYGDNNAMAASLQAYFEGDSEYTNRLAAMKRLHQNDAAMLHDTALPTALFGKHMYLSASRIEDYYNCAFRYFCKFGLGARPRTKAMMDPMQTGTVIHYVLERLISDNGSDTLVSLSSAKIKLLVNTYLEEYLHTKMGDAEQFTPRFKYQFMRLLQMLCLVAERLKAEFEQSDFTAKAFELTIGDGSEGERVRSKKITLPDGGTIEIKGAIDRVDVFEQNGEKYVRVVDYKSGKKEFSLNDLLYGLNLQMFIYLFTLAASESEYAGISGGVLYMHSSRALLSVERSEDVNSQITAKENDAFKMKGIILNDEAHPLAKHMEHSLEGKYIPAKYVKSKDCVVGNIVNLTELGLLAHKIDEMITMMGVRLHRGDIRQQPIHGANHDKTCDFCDYKDVCMNKTEIPLREMEKRSNAEVLQLLREEAEQDD